MRILIATAHQSIVGGVETYLRAALPRLRDRGHAITLVCEYPAGPGAAITDDCPDVPVLSPADALAARPDVCLIHGLTDPALEAALAERFPAVLYAHNYHGTCVSGTKRFAFPTARPCDRPFGAGCLAYFYPRRCGGRNPLVALGLYRTQAKRAALFPRYRRILVASRHMADEFRRNGVPGEQVRVLHYLLPGCEPDPAPPAPRPPSGRVLMLGRLTEVKGGRLLPPALRRAADRLGRPLSLVVAGEGPDLPHIRRAATRAEIPVEAVGWVDARRRAELMRAADLLAVPSTWPEPFGLVGVEAGCVGLPAVAFAVGGIGDWLRPGESGELAPGDPPTVVGLADAVSRALASADHWQRLRVGAWRVAAEFSPDRHIEELERELTRAAGP